jgi:hypothetical protein
MSAMEFHTTNDSPRDKNSHDEVMNERKVFEKQFPSKKAVDFLANDYKHLTSLMTTFEAEIGSFTNGMRKINNNSRDIAGLARLWDEQAKTIQRDVQECQIKSYPKT